MRMLNAVRRAEELPGWVAQDIETARHYLATTGLSAAPEATGNRLYAEWFISLRPPQVSEVAPFVGTYRAAHAASETFEEGWIVEELCPDMGPGAIRAVLGRDRRLLPPTDYLRADGGLGPVAVGQAILVTARRDRVGGGYWHSWTGDWASHRDEPLARLYWNVPAEMAMEFVARWTEVAAGLPAHSMKILARADLFNRADAASRSGKLLF